jgi:HEPN domain-containing protein
MDGLGVISIISPHEVQYVVWQNRALRFYLGARILHRNVLYAPAAYSAAMATELLLKGTLIYWDRSFDPLDAGHSMAKLVRMVKNKARSAKALDVPAYFYKEKRFLNASRYPCDGKGIAIPASFLEDLDKVFADLILLVPFQFNTELKHALSGKNRSALLALRYKNKQMQRLRNGHKSMVFKHH